METTEALILRNLIYNEDFTRKVLPFIKTEYFNDSLQKVLYDEISSFVVEYNALPTQESLYIELEKRTDLNEESFTNIVEIVSGLSDEPAERDWLLKTTEQWCKDRAVYLAIRECIQIADGSDSKLTKEAIPSILSDALAVSFDSHIGHDYLEDSDSRYESYVLKEDKLPFDLSYLNKITGGGLSAKTLTVFIASTGVGKSLAMCHFASSYLLRGKNVLYITLEMAEEKIAQRIDANLLDINIQDFSKISKGDFETKVQKLSAKTHGKLIIKEYPPTTAHSGHFKALISELKLKKSFVPDVIFIDYINICASSRFKSNGQVNTYSLVKSIAEELRSLAVEFNVPIISATQTNRCLGLDTIVNKSNGESIKIKDIKVGDKILSHSDYVTVKNIFKIEKQEVYEITTKSGKKIRCSNKHIFPTITGEKNILSGLSTGDVLFVKE
jgi:replicative DNA helicase